MRRDIIKNSIIALAGVTMICSGMKFIVNNAESEDCSEEYVIFEDDELMINPIYSNEYSDRPACYSSNKLVEETSIQEEKETDDSDAKRVIILKKLDNITYYDECEYYEPETVYEFNSTESNCLQRLAWSEAGTLGVEGMAHIMRVVLNRVESDQFPNTIVEVINQDGQFSVVSNGSYYEAEVNGETLEALYMIKNGWDDTYGATYFCTEESVNDWHRNVLTEVYTFSNVHFFMYLGGGE